MSLSMRFRQMPGFLLELRSLAPWVLVSIGELRASAFKGRYWVRVQVARCVVAQVVRG
jgi:hypothetical protein